jgi:hypothetical protein
MDAYDRCTNLEKKILLIVLPSMVKAEKFSDHPRMEFRIFAALITKIGLLGCNTMLFYRWVSGKKIITVQCQVGFYQNHGFHSSET